MLAGISFAEPAEPYLPYYWLTGNVTSDEVAVSDRMVVFYQDWETGEYITAETDASGDYQINVFELYYLYGIPITGETVPYFVAVPTTESSDWGTGEVVYLEIDAGFTEEDLVLVLGGGPGSVPEPEEPGEPTEEVLSITTVSLSVGTEEVAYPTNNLVATGGATPYTWAVTGEVFLPDGLSLSESLGELSGTPAVGSAGTYEVSFMVTDALEDIDTSVLNLVIFTTSEAGDEGEPTSEVLAIITESLPRGTEGRDYLVTLEAENGDGDYFWEMTDGELPAELIFSGDEISGTVATDEVVGDYELTFRVTDGAGETDTAVLVLEIISSDLAILTDSLPDGVAGDAYSTILEAGGGTEPYTWSTEFGVLPDTLILGSADGSISGTLSDDSAGNYELRFAVQDAVGDTATKYLTIEVSSVDIEGPQVQLKVLFEGLYDYSAVEQTATSVIVEVLDGATYAEATQLEDYISGTIDLGSDGEGANGIMNIDGIHVLPDGEYYLVIKQKLTDTDAGANHLPVLIYSAVGDGKIVLEDGATTVVDLTDTSAYLVYTPSTLAEDVVTTAGDGNIVLRAGNCNGDNMINSADFIIWKAANGTSVGDDDYDVQADINLDGRIQSDDFVLWKRNNGIEGQDLE